MQPYDLFLGDCLEIMATLSAGSVDTVITDPPYGTTRAKWDSPIPFGPMWEQLERVTKPHAPIVLFSAQPFTSALILSNPRRYRYDLIWERNAPTGHLNAKRQPLRDHEVIAVFSRRAHTYNPQKTPGPPNHARKAKDAAAPAETTNRIYGAYKRSEHDASGQKYPRSVIKIPKVNQRRGEKIHPTQKPLALLDYLIKTFSNPGDLVLDFTAGSGTTGAAALQNGRRFIGIEREPSYYEIAAQRLAGI